MQSFNHDEPSTQAGTPGRGELGAGADEKCNDETDMPSEIGCVLDLPPGSGRIQVSPGGIGFIRTRATRVSGVPVGARRRKWAGDPAGEPNVP